MSGIDKTPPSNRLASQILAAQNKKPDTDNRSGLRFLWACVAPRTEL